LDGKVKDVINGRSIDIREEREERRVDTSALKQSGSKLKVRNSKKKNNDIKIRFWTKSKTC